MINVCGVKRVAVTGSSGFIGSHLVAALGAAGVEVRTCDVRGGAPVDVTRDDLKESFHGVDAVVHLAAIPGVRDSWGRAFGEYARVNVLGTQRVLDACVANAVPRLVFASSSSVYGRAAELPTAEDGPLLPLSPYGVTKVTGEHLCAAYAGNSGGALETVALRYFTVYGPGQRPDMLIARLLAAARGGPAVRLFGDGRQERDFTYVGDAVRATLLALAAGSLGSPHTAVNVGSGGRVPVRDLVALVGELAGAAPALTRIPARSDEAARTEARLDRAAALLGYRPHVALADGLRRQLDALP